MRGDHVEVYFNGKKLIDVHDSTVTAPGKVGVWTKADSHTLLTISPRRARALMRALSCWHCCAGPIGGTAGNEANAWRSGAPARRHRDRSDLAGRSPERPLGQRTRSRFRQREPAAGTPASERTVVRVLRDRALYVAVRANDARSRSAAAGSR